MNQYTLFYLLDWFFVIFHMLLVGFNLFGWVWTKTRRLHLYVISFTIFSWVGLGLFYGWGYCPLTDWHWQVKRNLGETGLPASYIKYYLDLLTGTSWNPSVVDVMVAVLGISALLVSVYVNIRYPGKKQDERQV